MNFSDFNFDDNLKTQIENCFSSGRIPHAFIIEGAKEQQRLSLADFLAKAFVCKGDNKPCMQCSGCKKVMSNSHLDYIVYEGKGKTGAVGIDEIRQLRADVYIAPNEADRKVYLVKNAHKMNEYAQNALLKCLEEPPAYAVIMLECEDKSMLLETVRSRCACFRVGEMNREISQAKLQKAQQLASEMAKAVTEPSEASLMAIIGSFEKDKDLLKLSIRRMVEIVRQAVLISQGVEGDYDESASCLCAAAAVKQMMKMITTLNLIDEDLDKNANNNLLLSRMCYMLRRDVGR